MNLRDIVLLADNEEGMQQLITWFLNDVMNEEVAQQVGVSRHADRVQGEPIGMATGPDSSRPDSETSVSRNRNYERSRLKPKCSNDIPGPRKHS